MMPDDRPRETMLQVPGARLHVREIGAGTPLLVLHGGPDFDHHYFVPELDRLADAYRLFYYDQRGRGQSSPGVMPEDVTIDSEVDDLERVREVVGEDPVAVLGHSWGCVLALEWATRHPEHASHLVLMNPPPASYAELQRLKARRREKEMATLAAMTEIAETPEWAAGDIDADERCNRLHFSAAVHDKKHIDTIVRRLRVHFTPQDVVKARAIEDRLHEQTWSRPDYDLVSRLRGLATPALVIHGRDDFIPIESAAEIAHAIPGAEFRVFENCGHFAYMEQPGLFRDAIEKFVGPA